jgi:type I restriction-modification system DNA methylase subunit
VHNTQNYAEAYREVIHEDAIKVGAFTKAPDYCFRVGPARKFFVEAKKPSVNVKDDLAPAFQVRRYAWSAKLPLSILTDFEEFAVYDCRVKPDKNDKASTARIMYLTYTEFETRWDEIASVFSKDAVLKGSFDKYAQAVKGKKGTAEVDAAFLQEIEGWREVLARNIALRNGHLSQRELNFAVQQTIDRIIFLRICEDRGMEQEGKLAATTNGTNIYKRLCELFRLADNKYNSDLFNFSKETGRDLPDGLTLSLEIDDKPLKDIIKGLYYPDCPYEFTVIFSDILGQVYEQFLGKVIRLTDGHRAVVEDKPEVKKAGGVYYTPTYIVDYIVKNTVGKLLGDQGSGDRVQVKNTLDPQPKTLTPREASRLRILDPACGSGSFLIGAYQHLLDWHLEWYAANNPQKHATGKNPELYQSHSGDWKLTLAERKRILLDNIYGVDIDPQAVEVTKLSLLLKVLEGESEQSVSGKQKLLHTRVLPDLDRNIKCGNSLIGPDFHTAGAKQALPMKFDNEESLQINAFDWKAEFPDIMKSGGFDAVIGNPPYVFLTNDLFSKDITQYLNSYKVAQYRTDLFHLFIQKGIDLVNQKGLLGYIVPNTWFTIHFTTKLREYVLKTTIIDELVLFEHKVFQNADVHTGLIFLEKGLPDQNHQLLVKKYSAEFKNEDLLFSSPIKVFQSSFLDDAEYRFELRQTGVEGILTQRLLKQFPVLENILRASLGC